MRWKTFVLAGASLALAFAAQRSLAGAADPSIGFLLYLPAIVLFLLAFPHDPTPDGERQFSLPPWPEIRIGRWSILISSLGLLLLPLLLAWRSQGVGSLDPWVLLVAGLLWVMLSLRLFPHRGLLPSPKRRVLLLLHLLWIGLALLVILPGRLLYHDALTLYLGASLLLSYTLVKRSRRAKGLALYLRGIPWQGVALGLILLLAFFLRAYRIDSLPYGVWFDEAQNGLEASRILQDPSYRPIFIPGLSQLPALFFYLIALLIKFLGANVVAVRALSVVAGSLSVFFFYLLARELFGWRIALVGAILLALSRWHINFSRFGMHGILTVLFETAAIYFLLRGLRRGSRWDYLWSGVALGLGLHGYYASNLVPIILALFLLHKLLFDRRSLSRRSLEGVAILVFSALVIFLPLGWYALQNPGAYLQRVETASLFRGKSEAEARQALLENVKKHLGMFNWRGDRNGRHNLPGEPMLDFATAALFVLGLGYTLYRWRRSHSFLILTWFGVMLAPGVLSLDFEAPQAYRSLGVIPAVYLLVSAALFALWDGWRRHLPGKEGYLAIGLVILVGWIGFYNLDTYFGRQAKDFAVWASFSTTETEIARFLRAQGDGREIYISQIYAGHPTIRFLVPEYGAIKLFSPSEDVPISRSQDRDAVYALEPSLAYVVPILQRAYPGGLFKEERDPYGHTLFISGLVKKEEIASAHGLEARYFAGTDWSGQPLVSRAEPGMDLVWPGSLGLRPPFSVEWRGSLFATRYGAYRIAAESSEEVSISLDGVETLQSDGGLAEKELVLAQGLHPLLVRASGEGQGGRVRLLWRPPEGSLQPIPHTSLFMPRVPSNGLVGYYYANDGWRGSAAFARLDPAISFYFHLNPLPRPYSIEWRGKIALPSSGVYRFGTESIDFSWLYIDEKLVVDNGDRVNQYKEAEAALEAGLHDLRLRYLDRSNYPHVYLYWQPPGGSREVVPSSQLFPSPEAYAWEREVAATVPTPEPPKAEAIPAELGDLSGKLLARWGGRGSGAGQFLEPRNMASDSLGNLYVVDYGNQRIQKFDENGRFLASWGKRGSREGEFKELFDLAIDRNNVIYALDTGRGAVLKFTEGGTFLSVLDLAGHGVYNPRAIAVDAEGNLLIADTGNNRWLKLDASGRLLLSVGRRGSREGEFQEPGEIALDGVGNIYVVDTDNHRLQKFDASGRFLLQWRLPGGGGGMNSPRVALDPRGDLLISVQGGRLLQFGVTGEMQGGWRVGTEASLPMPIALDRQGNLFLAQIENHSLGKYALEPIVKP